MAVIYSNLAQHTLSQSTNISYLIRNATRMGTVPDDRQADYSFRDLFMTVAVTCLNEWAMRLSEALYMAPNYVRLLGFHNFGNEYHGVPGAKNYSLLPRPLESRMLGLLASEKSFYQIGNLLRDYDTRKLKPGTDAYNERKILGEHFERRYDPRNYFRTYYQLDTNAERANKKADALKAVIDSAKKEEIQHFAVDDLGRTVKTPSPEAQKVLDRLFKEHEKTLSDAFGSKWKTEIFSHISHGKHWDKSVSELIQDGLTSRFVQQAIRHTRVTGTWTKLLSAILSNTVAYAIIGNWVDFNVIQPWQQKFVEKRGTSKEVVSPQIWSLIPATAIFTAMHFATKKVPGYAMRFSLNMGTALSSYVLITALWIKNRLSQPPKGKYAKYAEHGLHTQAEKQNRAQVKVSNNTIPTNNPFRMAKQPTS